MSFGYSIGDALTLVQLAWRTVEGARKACGEHDDLTTEVLRHHAVLSHVQSEISNPESAINHSDASRTTELRRYISGCERHLRSLELILDRYNSLSEAERSIKKLWHKVRFGNGEVQNVAAIRRKMMTYTSAISMTLQLVSLGSQGRMEQRLPRQGGDLEGISQSLNLILARLNIELGEGSIMTDYTGDDKTIWRELRRELVMEGYRSSSVRRHKHLIKAYVMELGTAGVLNEEAKGKEPLAVVRENEGSSEESDTPIENDQEDLPAYTSSPTSSAIVSHVKPLNQISSDLGRWLTESYSSDWIGNSVDNRTVLAIEDKPKTATNGSQVYRSPFVEDGSNESGVEDVADDETKRQDVIDTREFIGPEDDSPSSRQHSCTIARPMSIIEISADVTPVVTHHFDSEIASPLNVNVGIILPSPLPDESEQVSESRGPLETCWVFYAHPYINDLERKVPSSTVSKYILRRRFHVFKEWSPCVSEEFRAKLHNGYTHFESIDAWRRESSFMHKIRKRFRTGLELSLVEMLHPLEKEFYDAVCPMPVLPVPNALRMVSIVRKEDISDGSVRQIWEIGKVTFCFSATNFDARSLSCWLYDWAAYSWGMGSIRIGRVKTLASQLISFDDSFGRLCSQLLTDLAPFDRSDQWQMVEQGEKIWSHFKRRFLDLTSSAEAAVEKEARSLSSGPGKDPQPNRVARPIEVFYVSTLEKCLDENAEWGWKDLSVRMKDWCDVANGKFGVGIFQPEWP